VTWGRKAANPEKLRVVGLPKGGKMFYLGKFLLRNNIPNLIVYVLTYTMGIRYFLFPVLNLAYDNVKSFPIEHLKEQKP